MLTHREPAVLVLEDGRTFRGDAYGAAGETVGEAVFSTGMTGYQETLTDPSYHRQVVVMTAPHVGNTGVNDEDAGVPPDLGRRLRRPRPRPACRRTGARGAASTTSSRDQGVVGICGVDTRALTRHLRERGAMRVGIFSADAASRPPAELLAGSREPPRWPAPTWPPRSSTAEAYVVPAVGERRFTVAAVDLGIKAMHAADDGRARHRGARAARPRPPSRTCWRWRPTGSSSPTARATPRPPTTQVELLRGAAARTGSRTSASASATRSSAGRSGFGTYKLKYGHRGINQPVMDRTTGKVEITAHNHGFAVDAPLDGRHRAPSSARPTVSHVCLNDDVVEGLELRDGERLVAFSVQYHPEAAAGPHDAAYLFDRFIDLMADLHGQDERTDAQARRHQERPGHRLRADRHRAGLRVRLLRHPGLPGAARGGAAGHPGQLQPGHDHDRPGVRRRHLRRADHPRVRREDHRQGAPGRAAADPRRADRAQRRDGPGRARRPREVRRRADRRQHRGDRARRGPREVQGDRRALGARVGPQSTICHIDGRRASPPPTTSATRWSSGPSFTMGGTGSGHRLRRGRPAPDRRRRACSTARPPRCSSRSRSSAGRSTSSRSCATTPTTSSIVCSIENLDPMGVHTGDSITVAPAHDADRPRVPAACATSRIAIIREVGVDTGGCNIQFAVDPATAG